MESLSAIDIRILEQLQRNSAQSTSELADKVGLSQSPCWRRLQRLREEGYIDREVAILNRKLFGPSVFVFATLKIGTLLDEQRADFVRKLELIPEVLECYTVFGERDLLLKILASTIEWYQDFVFRTLMKLPGVIDVQSIVATSELKYTTAMPVRGKRAL